MGMHQDVERIMIDEQTIQKRVAEVAKQLDISRSYVSRIEKKALEKLRENFGDTSPAFDSN